MKKALILLALILSFKSMYSQDIETKDNYGFTTIGYFSSKNLIGIKGKILKLENYTFLQIELDEELYTSDYDTSSGISFNFDLGNGKLKSDYAILTPISNEISNKKVHLILLKESEIETLKQYNIMEIEISLGYSTTYNFKNIQEPNFFINQLK
jgi:hypothetical protein